MVRVGFQIERDEQVARFAHSAGHCTDARPGLRPGTESHLRTGP